MAEETTSAQHTDRLSRIFNTQGKRTALYAAGKLSVPLIVGIMYAVPNFHPLLTGAYTALTFYLLTRSTPSRDLNKPVYQTGVLRVSAFECLAIGGVSVMVGMAGYDYQTSLANQESERKRLDALPPYAEAVVTIPAEQLDAREYFCRDRKTGTVSRKLPSGEEHKFNCAPQP